MSAAKTDLLEVDTTAAKGFSRGKFPFIIKTVFLEVVSHRKLKSLFAGNTLELLIYRSKKTSLEVDKNHNFL